jgi:hypothetical protein
MPVTGDPNAVAICTFKGVPLSMGDCFIKITPEATQTIYEVTGQFLGIDSASPFDVSGAARAKAEDYLAEVVSLVGGIALVQEITGPKGKRVVVPSSYVVGTLINPFSGERYSGLVLTGVQSGDSGGKHYSVTYTFTKPVTEANDGTTASTVLFNAVQIGDRGGSVSVSFDSSTMKISATSQYVGANPLTYLQGLCNTLGLESVNVSPVPRAAATARAAIRSYNAVIGTFEWKGKGTIASAVMESLSASEETPGILTINTSFVASR